ncbi:cell division protein BolA [Aliidiomarina sedimenti]|uniref:Cell division protein BolA n=1 Tax=Aliidiomarina sedimenti TaxID=1933879 RepID=A0ABY0BZV5_9GAMM|nr:BolA family protein [Aliidiomarina sedimenti]RUO30591.1 cell division protein BolA [Aliidiomarina sedimenti]
MDAQEIAAKLREAIDLEDVFVKTDGSHVEVIAVGAVFADVPRVKQQQMIYAPLNAAIADGSIHALSIKAYTPEQWRRDKLLNQPS